MGLYKGYWDFIGVGLRARDIRYSRGPLFHAKETLPKAV